MTSLESKYIQASARNFGTQGMVQGVNGINPEVGIGLLAAEQATRTASCFCECNDKSNLLSKP
jgi:hypothetical protein